MAALFFDIDGTLIDEHFIIPESTKLALVKAKQNGHRIYINSGRTRAFIHDEDLLALPFDGLLCGCGTHLIVDGKDLLYHPLSDELLHRSIGLMYANDMPLILEGRKFLYMDMDMIGRDRRGKAMFSSLQKIIRPVRNNEANWEGTKFSVVLGNADYEKVFDAFSDELLPLIHDGEVAELVPKGFSKATAIEAVCAYDGIPVSETYAFGDGANDIEMLDFAGCGIAMGNARPIAKEHADFVTRDIHREGIAYALEKLGLI